jgi:hypothetical protein
MNDNRPATYQAYLASHDTLPATGSQINVIATDSPPHVLRNVAIYYAQMNEPGADAMARRLRAAASAAKQELRRAA